MICGDPFSLHSSLPPCLPLSRHWGITVCELLVRVFSQGPQPGTDRLTVAVSGTLILEVLWQASQWKCSTQLFAAGYLIYVLAGSLLYMNVFFFSTTGYNVELGLAEAEVSPNSWTSVFLLLLVYCLFLSCLRAQAACYSCMALLGWLWRNDSKCLMWLEMCRPHKVPWDPSPKDHRPQCMLLTLSSLCHREGSGTNTQPPYSLPSLSLLSSKPVSLRISIQ